MVVAYTSQMANRSSQRRTTTRGPPMASKVQKAAKTRIQKVTLS